MTLNVWVPFYDDLDWLSELVDTIPEGVHVYAIDGRHDTFPGEDDLTEGAAEYCHWEPDVSYHAPHPRRLPWGSAHPDAPPEHRLAQHEKACYANYEVLPEDEWVLKLDTDERVQRLDLGVLAELNEKMRYSPRLTPLDERGYQPMRLYVPQYWTFWLADQYFPREFYPPDTPVETLINVTATTNHGGANWGGIIEDIHIENIGRERPEEYRQRRKEQLERIGRLERAAEYDDSVT